MNVASTREIVRSALHRTWRARQWTYAATLLAVSIVGQLGLQLAFSPSLAVQLYLAAFSAGTLVPLGYVAGRVIEHLQQLALHDAGTGLWNRRYLATRLADEVCAARRDAGALSVLFVDVDDLKAINDIAGHKAGDRALRTVADALRRALRTTDVATRFGGDEFLVIAPNTPLRDAVVLADHVRLTLHKLGPPALTLPPVTVSIGVVDVELAGCDGDALLKAADAAMYAAKALGGDRNVVAPQTYDARAAHHGTLHAPMHGPIKPGPRTPGPRAPAPRTPTPRPARAPLLPKGLVAGGPARPKGDGTPPPPRGHNGSNLPAFVRIGVNQLEEAVRDAVAAREAALPTPRR